MISSSNEVNSQIPSLIEQDINKQLSDNIDLNKKFEDIFLNLLNNNQINLSKIIESNNFLIFFEYIFNRMNDIFTNEDIPSKKNDIFKFLSVELINNLEKIKEKKEQQKFDKYFYNLNFFEIFLEILKNKETNEFKLKLRSFLQVSLVYFILF